MTNTSETMVENNIGIKIDNNDYFLKGFLDGYSREKDRIHGFRVKKEEKVKREIEVRMGVKEWRSKISDMIEKEVKYKLDDMKRTLEYLNEDRRKLKIEIEELKMKLEDDAEEKRIENLNEQQGDKDEEVEKEEKVEVKEEEKQEEEEEEKEEEEEEDEEEEEKEEEGEEEEEEEEKEKEEEEKEEEEKDEVVSVFDRLLHQRQRPHGVA